MSATTKIQWCDATVNFWWGCAKVSAGCTHCYAEKFARYAAAKKCSWGPDGKRWLRVGEAAGELLRLEKKAIRLGRRLRVFINSMSDTFEDRRDLDGARRVLWVIAPCVPHLDLLLLTKRPENIQRLTPAAWHAGEWPANVWLGTTVESQDTAARLSELLRFPAPVRFASCEPLVGPVDLGYIGDEAGHHDALRGAVFCEGRNEPAETRRLDWVIVGGESGARKNVCPLDLDWVRDLRDQCAAAKVAVFVKQLGRLPIESIYNEAGKVTETEPLRLKDAHGGDPSEWPAEFRVREFPSVPSVSSVGNSS